MADLNPDIPADPENLALPEGVDMDELVQNITKLAMQFVNEQGKRTQLYVFFGFLLIPISLILYCFCKILNNQRKRYQVKEKKKQKEQKKEIKKDTKKDTKKDIKKKV